MTITFKIDNLRDVLAPVYNRYPGQTNAQPAYVEMCEDGTITADSDGNIGGGMSFDVYHGRTIRWGINNSLRGDTLADTLEQRLDLFQRVHDGQSIEWNGNNYVGRLDDDAQEAHDEIAAELDALSSDESSLTPVWEVDRWLENTAFDDIWPEGKTLDEAIEAIEVEATLAGIELEGRIKDCLLYKAERANDRDDCFRPEVLAALFNANRAPYAANGDWWAPNEN